jgi:hypothetical protein
MCEDDVQWVVNDNGELGVCVNGGYFFLYKGRSLQYGTDSESKQVGIALHDDNTPMMVRPVGKREFGETCQPITCMKVESGVLYDRTPRPYREELTYIPGLSFGEPSDAEWKLLPAPMV